MYQFRSAGWHPMKQTMLKITIEIYQEQKKQLHKAHPPSLLDLRKYKSKDRI